MWQRDSSLTGPRTVREATHRLAGTCLVMPMSRSTTCTGGMDPNAQMMAVLPMTIPSGGSTMASCSGRRLFSYTAEIRGGYVGQMPE